MKKVTLHIVAAILGLWLATMYVSGVLIEIYPDSNFFGISLTANWQIIILLGIILGLLNHFVKPILDLITLPLRIITLGFFGFVTNVVLVWLVDIMIEEFSAPLIYPILLTTLIIWGLSILLIIIFYRKDE